MATFGRGTGTGGGGGIVDLAPADTSSGTAHDVTDIAEDAVFVAVIISGVSANASNRLVLKLGPSTGFTGQPASASFALNTADVAAGEAQNLVVELRRIGTTNTWIASGDYSGATTLTGPLERVQLTLNTIGQSDAFDAGKVAVQYSSREGVGPIASTADLPEGSSGPYYYTDARADARIALATLDDLADVPAPQALKLLRRNSANSSYELIDEPTVSSLFGISGTPSARQSIRRNAGNTAWEFYTPSSGGNGNGIALTDLSASGIVSYDNTTGAFSTNTSSLATAIDGIVAVNAGGGISKSKSGDTITLTVPAVPVKASASEVSAGTDDGKFVTPLQLARERQSVNDGTDWSGFTYTSGTPSAGQFTYSGTNAAGFTFTFETTEANAEAMDAEAGPNSYFHTRRDQSNEIVGKIAYAWRTGTTFAFKCRPNATVTGSIQSGSCTLNIEGELYTQLREQDFLVEGDILAGANIQVSEPDSDGRITISGSGSSVSKASKSEALAGTDDTKFMTPLRVHDVVDHSAKADRYAGLQYTTSQGQEMAIGTWTINAGGTRAWFRGHTQAEAEAFARDFLIDRYFILGRNGQRIEAQFTDVTNVAVSGSNIGVVQCDIGSHSATPTNPTLTVGDEWDLALLSPAAQALFKSIPHAAITAPAIAPGAVGVSQLLGQQQECLMFMDNDSGGRNQNIRDDATTAFGTGTVTTEGSGNVRSWAVGGNTSNNGEHFDQRENFSLISGDTQFCQFRAEDGGVYSIHMDGCGTFYMKHAEANFDPRVIGLEVGLQFGDRAIGATDWEAWTHCGNTDVSRTIGGSSTTVYDASAFYGNSNFLSNQNKTVYRTKGAVPRNGDVNIPADIGPPFWAGFVVGKSGAPFPVNDREYRFRFVFYAPSYGSDSNDKVLIQRIYNYREKMVATRRA